MHSDRRSRLLDHLQQACCDAARGALDPVARHIRAAGELLDQAAATPGASASLQAARSYLKDAQAALVQSDSLEVILPLFAALQIIQQEEMEDCERQSRERKDPGMETASTADQAYPKARAGSR